jgi:hypothetical protein
MNSKARILAMVFVAGSAAMLLAACGAQSGAGAAQPPTPVVYTDLVKAGVDWMDHLKTCTPFAQSMDHPFLKKSQQINTIQGKDGDYCLMTMETTNFAVLTCKLDADGVKALTRDELYEQAKSGVMSGSTEDPSGIVMNTQCETRLLKGTPEAK